MSMDITKLTAIALAEDIRQGNCSIKDALDAYYKKIEEQEPDINAFITLNKENAYAEAEKLQKDIDSGIAASPLAGVPVAVKDNICTKGLRTTCASKMLSDFVPAYDAEAVCRLKKAGMIIIGKTNMDEFAFGSTSESSFFGPVKNPADITRVSGGSSGGSCAAVAANEAPVALGSDTGGSIRQPSSFCGVVGLKPTYGLVSRFGLVAHASSLDQIGPVSKDVRDCAALLGIIAGKDSKDSTSAAANTADYLNYAAEGARRMQVGVPAEFFDSMLSDEIKSAVCKAVEILKQAGALVEEFSFKIKPEYAAAAYYVISSAEASSNLERFDGVKYGFRAEKYGDLDEMYKKTRSEGFGSEAKRRIMLGTFVLSSGYYEEYYLKAVKVRNLIKRSFDEAFSKYDVILAPVSPSCAPRLGKYSEDPIRMYLEDIYTVSANLAGIPAMSVPCGKTREGLPVGVQLIGNSFCENTLFKAAYVIEHRR